MSPPAGLPAAAPLSAPLLASLSASLPAPSAEALAHSRRLSALIAAETARAGGWIGFDRYMQLALYAPGLGYYAAGARKFGDATSGGDFVTAPEISPLFAAALARQVEQAFDHCALQVLEFGAGTGVLARDLLAALAAFGPRGRPPEYMIVEVSADLRARQQATLGARGIRNVRWLDAPPPGFDGVVIANEVLDAMPARLFVKSDGAVRERGIVGAENGFRYASMPADQSLLDAVRAIEAETGPLPDGYGSEIGSIAAAWMGSVAEWLARGLLLVIDYGFPRREYYHPQRAMGTLMCHYRQHAHTDPLWLPGLNDITAHLDFTALADAAHGAGLRVAGFTSQANFLLNCGLLDALRQRHTPAAVNQAQRLLSEAEMGELFKVLAVTRGLDETPLVGFARGDRLHRL
jgi:SAM-dependent MidA family methyltransferase